MFNALPLSFLLMGGWPKDQQHASLTIKHTQEPSRSASKRDARHIWATPTKASVPQVTRGNISVSLRGGASNTPALRCVCLCVFIPSVPCRVVRVKHPSGGKRCCKRAVQMWRIFFLAVGNLYRCDRVTSEPSQGSLTRRSLISMATLRFHHSVIPGQKGPGLPSVSPMWRFVMDYHKRKKHQQQQQQAAF